MSADSAVRALLLATGGALATGALAATQPGADLATVAARLGAYAGQATEPGPFRWAAGAGAALLGLAAASQLASGWFPRVRPRGTVDEAEGDAGASVTELVAAVQRRVAEALDRPEPDIIAAFDVLLGGALRIGASDLHLSPTPDALRATYRVQGTLREAAVARPEIAPLLSTRVKVLARLDTYIHGKPQDGRLVTTLAGSPVEARVSTLPTEAGERIVLRFLRGGAVTPEIETLGFAEDVRAKLVEMLARPQGLLFVTGPVGSGKTTTLYAALQHIARTRGSTTTMVTLEDPIELQLPFATQTQMNPRAGMTFAGTLRSVLRQDPNVLMLGEIRDRETAEIAMQAGLTGHLILTTVHGDSAAGAFARLIEMDVEPFVLASASIGSVSQRLVRLLCTACRRPADPEPIHVERFARQGLALPKAQYWEPVGCTFCEGLGFAGRAPIAEVMLVTPALRQAVHQRRPTAEIQQLAITEGMRSFLVDGLERAVAGETSLTEVLRVSG
ncbi:MAG: type II/IV secretion system protein [Polyangiaceae bacterium]|nr:type II/IV secretion system protein [Polyangiaceae bacterium]